MKIKYFLLSTYMLFSANTFAGTADVRQQFERPSGDAKPWTFWYWMFGAVSTDGITADLEAMRDAGLGGAYLMPIKGVAEGAQYEGKAQQLSPEWWRMLDHSFKEADRLGLKLGMHICDGFALAGGPWITPAESMQKVVWSDTIVVGGKMRDLSLPVPESFQDYYEDIAAYAIPLDKQPSDTHQSPLVTYGNIDAVPLLKPVSRDDKGVFRSSSPCWIQYEYAEPITVRNVEIVLSGNNYQSQRMKLLASDDGVNFKLVKQMVPARQGWQNYDFQSTHAVPPTTARFFRFEWTPAGSEPGSEDLDAAKWKPDLKIKDILLHSSPKVHQWEGKAGLAWRVASETTADELPADNCIRTDEIIVLPALANGKLTVSLPKGSWRILRMGHTATGHTNATAGGGKGLECDKFSKKAVQKQFDNWFARMFEHTDADVARRVLKYMHVDSWECGSQNWSDNFAAEFKSRRGYDLMPYLPLLAGVPIESAERSEKVLRDVRTTINDLITDVFFTVLADNASRYDCLFSAECVSPTMVSDGLTHYQKVDLPMGEFWLNSPTHDKPNDMLDAISGAHIYGKRIIQAEGFTEVRGVWDEDPAMLKPLLDRNFALGINKLFFHVYTHNPWLDRKPGMTLDGIGLFFQRDQTWWSEGKAFVDYVARCQALLQYGVPVTDIAVFTGEEMPRRAILPDRLVSMLPGIFGDERVESERVRLANVGQPTRVRPVGVTHSANMADPEDWVNPLRGYAYDSFNKDALLRLADVKDGKLILPGGAEYSILVLPTAHQMNPDNLPLSAEAAIKVEQLKKGGVIVPELPFGADDFSALGVERDVELPGNVAWTHRRGDDMDLYFIADQSGNKRKSSELGNTNNKRSFVASFRIAGRTPEIWNPQTGEIYTPKQWEERGGRINVELTLPENGSLFVVFPKASSSAQIPVEVAEADVEPLVVKRWSVEFPSTGVTLQKDTLFDWSKEENEKVRYYSGKANYNGMFMWKRDKRNSGRVFLRLGDVKSVATVKLNGKECGIAWTAPYEIEITDALRNGKNTIEVTVTNTWANALRGADSGKAQFDGIWTNAKYRMAGDALIPSGWFGPAELVTKR
jgi:hypothetical protein